MSLESARLRLERLCERLDDDDPVVLGLDLAIRDPRAIAVVMPRAAGAPAFLLELEDDA